MAIIDDVARNLHKDVGDVGILDLLNAGVSATEAMRQVGSVAERAMKEKPKAYPPGFRPPDVANNPTPAALQLGNASLGQALMDLITKKPPSPVVSIPEKDWGNQVVTKKPPVYSNAPVTPGPVVMPGPVVTPPVAAPALGTGALVAAGLGFLMLMLFMGRR